MMSPVRSKLFALALWDKANRASGFLVSEQQEQMPPPPPSMAQAQPSAGAPAPASGAPQDPAAMQQPPPPSPDLETVDTLVDNINVIRAGKSLNDPGVHTQLVSLWQQLQPAEKQQHDKFLADIGAIMKHPPDVTAQQQQQPPPPPSTGAPPPPPQSAQQPPPMM